MCKLQLLTLHGTNMQGVPDSFPDVQLRSSSSQPFICTGGIHSTDSLREVPEVPSQSLQSDVVRSGPTKAWRALCLHPAGTEI